MILLLAAAAAASLGSAAQPVFGWRDAAVYAVTTRPGRITDIALQPGESLSATGGVAAGDTVRWIIGDSESGAGAARQVHVLVKPVAADIATNLVIATDRRTYHLELRSGPGGYMASVSWRYPQGELIALEGRPASPLAMVAPAPRATPAPEPDLAALNFGYRIEGRAAWRPLRVFDDGRRTAIDFPPSVSAGELPPLFSLGAKDEAELVNYRVEGRRIIVDHLFDVAELRLGAGRNQVRVRLVREAKVARP
jgi:type IV secretion system protein VirB9